jgi:hypothetical protein
VSCDRCGAELTEGARYCSRYTVVAPESGMRWPESTLRNTEWAVGSVSWLLGLFILVGCENKNRGAYPPAASHEVIAAPSPNSLPKPSAAPLTENGREASLAELQQNYLNALEQAKQNDLAAIERSNESYSRAMERYQQEYLSTVDRYRSMTPEERARIHPKSLAQIGRDHDMELTQAKEEYYAAVEKAKENYRELARLAPAVGSAPATSPERGEAESIPGTNGQFVRYPYGHIVGELCSETTVNDCYPYDWQPWLKELERRTVGEQINALEADIGVQGKGHLVISWNTEKRILFGAWPPNSGDKICVYFIVAPKTRELDIVWKKEDGVSYLGPNASMLKDAHVYEWLKALPW